MATTDIRICRGSSVAGNLCNYIRSYAREAQPAYTIRNAKIIQVGEKETPRWKSAYKQRNR